MSLEHSPARQGDRGAYSIPAFCAAHAISRSTLYAMWDRGIGPRCMRVGVRRLISIEAAARWRREREADAAAEER